MTELWNSEEHAAKVSEEEAVEVMQAVIEAADEGNFLSEEKVQELRKKWQ